MLLSATAGLAGSGLAVRLMAYRMDLLPISVLGLGLGFYLAYRRHLGPRWNRIALWLATALSVLFWLSPYIVRMRK